MIKSRESGTCGMVKQCLPANQDWQEHSIEQRPLLSWLHPIVIASVVVAVALVGPVAALAAVAAPAVLAEPVAALVANSSIDSMQLVVKTFAAMQIAVETEMI